jgi:hypothetical protein
MRWRSADANAVGMQATRLQALSDVIAGGTYPGVNSLIIVLTATWFWSLSSPGAIIVRSEHRWMFLIERSSGSRVAVNGANVMGSTDNLGEDYGESHRSGRHLLQEHE